MYYRYHYHRYDYQWSPIVLCRNCISSRYSCKMLFVQEIKFAEQSISGKEYTCNHVRDLISTWATVGGFAIFCICNFSYSSYEYNDELCFICPVTGIILGMGSANTRRRYNVTSSLIGWAHIQNDLFPVAQETLLYFGSLQIQHQGYIRNTWCVAINHRSSMLAFTIKLKMKRSFGTMDYFMVINNSIKHAIAIIVKRSLP